MTHQRNILKHVICGLSLAALLLLPACAKKKSNWDGSYEKVYQRTRGDNDSGYKAPSVLSCVNDDLYQCN